MCVVPSRSSQIWRGSSPGTTLEINDEYSCMRLGIRNRSITVYSFIHCIHSPIYHMAPIVPRHKKLTWLLCYIKWVWPVNSRSRSRRGRTVTIIQLPCRVVEKALQVSSICVLYKCRDTFVWFLLKWYVMETNNLIIVSCKLIKHLCAQGCTISLIAWSIKQPQIRRKI